MEGIRKTKYGYIINDFQISRNNSLWHHTMDRVLDFEKKYTDKDDFEKKMVTRLKRIKNLEKVYYTIAVLVERGHNDIAEIYDGRLVMESLTDGLDFLDEL